MKSPLSKLYAITGKPKILGIACSKRAANSCARENAVSTAYLKMALNAAEKHGAETKLIELKDLKINSCNGCYSTCPAQCRFNEKTFQCDCFPYKEDTFFPFEKNKMSIKEAYKKLSEKVFFEIYDNMNRVTPRDDMWIIYQAMMKSDGIIFATDTNYYGRPALLQTMFSRLCAIDGGVEKIWGDGKNLANSIKYSNNPKNFYKQRLYGKWSAFINCSKEGDSVSPDLMKACTMMGMRILPMGVAYRVNWYNDPTHRQDYKNSLKDEYSINLAKNIGKTMIEEIKKSDRTYGIKSKVV